MTSGDGGEGHIHGSRTRCPGLHEVVYACIRSRRRPVVGFFEFAKGVTE